MIADVKAVLFDVDGTLTEAGAVAVYESPAELLERLPSLTE